MPRTKSSESKSENQIVKQVTEIIKFMGENRLAEIDLETSYMKMSLKKHSESVSNVVVTKAVQPPVQANIEQAEPVVEAVAEQEASYHEIISPMTGTFYKAPSPESAPFTELGASVKEGQTVCIVEAMKMMNEIKADKSGKVVEVLAENGQPVEKGAALFRID